MNINIARQVTSRLALLLALAALSDAAHAQQGFIVTGDKIINSSASSESIRISERLPIAQLKRRFSKYDVRSTAGEGCLICAVVSRGNFGFEIHYDEDGIVVTQIFCRGPGCGDSLGNKTGGSLRRALGQEARCDAGEETTCESFKLSGLSYIVREDKQCELRIPDGGKQTSIPDCARIEGFSIAKP